MNRTASSTLMTEGSIWKKIVTFAFPLFLGNLFQQLYNTADSLIVGNFLGSDALAAVSSSGSLIFLMVGFFNGIAMGRCCSRPLLWSTTDRPSAACNPYGCCLRYCRRYFADDHRSDPRSADAGLDGHTGRRPDQFPVIFPDLFYGLAGVRPL